MNRFRIALSKLLTKLLWLTVPLQVGALLFLGFHFVYFVPLNPASEESKIISIKPNTSFKGVTELLKAQKLIRSSIFLQLLDRFRSSTNTVKFGEYSLSPSMSSYEILNILRKGRSIPVKVVIPEGASLSQIALILKDQSLSALEEFNRLTKGFGLITPDAAVELRSLEGYLFPNTYFFSQHSDTADIIATMLKEGEKRWSYSYQQRAELLGMTKHQVLTLASIVEKESSDASEQPLIASVFLNRLKQNIKLQSDPTVIYGLPNFNGNLTKADLTTPTPYNTYTNFGIPPGPICSPGESAIRSVLFPAETDYLYFVSNGKGNHVFSNSYDEHQKAVRLYQLGTTTEKS
jgi:UPF0755 protein